MTDKRYTLKDKTQDREKHFNDKDDAKDSKQFLESEGHEVELIDNYNEGQPVDAEIVDHSPDGGEVVDVNAVSEDTKQIQTQEEFVTRVKGVPDAFMVNMGTPDNKSIHIKKEGYYYLAAEAGIDVKTEPLNPSWEGDDETAFWKATATKGDSEWSNVGSAHLEGEDMAGAEYNLDELASTRAACRVLSMATGAGVTSVIEMSADKGQ